MIKKPEIREAICEKIQATNKSAASVPLPELLQVVLDADKDLFIKFRDS